MLSGTEKLLIKSIPAGAQVEERLPFPSNGDKNQEMSREILSEKIIPVHGTTKLILMDPEYDQKGTDSEFSGNISASPLGNLIIRKVHIIDSEWKIEYDSFEVEVLQSAYEEELKLYTNGRYYPRNIKKKYELNCETAHFYIETKYGSDTFSTGADGDYAHLIQMKQHHGMTLFFSFDDDMFTFEELEDRFLKLFKERNVDQ